MKAHDVISYFGSIRKVAEAIGVQRQAVWRWTQRSDGMVPPLSAAKIHDKTRGKIRFDPEDYSGWYDTSKREASCLQQ